MTYNRFLIKCGYDLIFNSEKNQSKIVEEAIESLLNSKPESGEEDYYKKSIENHLCLLEHNINLMRKCL